jgi:hypothetical protein
MLRTSVSRAAAADDQLVNSRGAMTNNQVDTELRKEA